MATKSIVEQFEVLLEPEEEGGYHVWCPRLGGCHSQGETREEALTNIKEAIEGWLEAAGEVGIFPLERGILNIERSLATNEGRHDGDKDEAI